LRLCLCRHKATRLRRDRRGQATVIGSIFFFMIALSLITFIFEIAQNQIAMQHQDAERVTETVDSEILVLPDGNLSINVENRGPIPVNLIGLWVIDKDDNIQIRYDIPDEKSDVFPWEEIEIRTDEDTMNPEWTALDDEHEYSIRLVTDRGNIIEVRPFYAISGETIALSAYPPWVSVGETDIEIDGLASPVYEISKAQDDVTPYDGLSGFLSIKNTGNVAFILTFNSRVIFINDTTGVYTGELSEWAIWDAEAWEAGPSGGIGSGEDSRAIYPDDIVIVKFVKPSGGYEEVEFIQSDYTYHVYLHLAGYDERGNTYFQNIYYGIVPSW